MADSTSGAKDELKGQRRAVREHVEKYKKYPDKRDKDFALKTIGNARSHIARLKSKHPSLDSSWEDTWRP